MPPTLVLLLYLILSKFYQDSPFKIKKVKPIQLKPLDDTDTVELKHHEFETEPHKEAVIYQ